MSLRVERLDFRPWGCFEDHTLEFAGEPGTVELVYGLNAAGKLTASRGGRSLLYGIEVRTADRHTFDYADLRIGGRLVLDGKPVELVRRKGRTGTLTDPDGGALPDDTIAVALGGLTEDVYRGLFEISHNSLVQGGAELLQGRGEVGASLFAAAAGIATLHETLSGLDVEAERIFKPRGRTDPLHKAITDLHAAQKRMREATLRPAGHRKMERELRQIEDACEELSVQIRELDGKVRSLERKRAVAPLLDRHAELSEELASLADIPELAADAAERRSGAQSRLRSGATQLQRAKNAVSELEEQMTAIDVDEELLASEQEITAVHEQAPVTRKAAEDRPKVESLLAEAEAGLAVAAATIGVAPDEVEGLRRPATARRALDTCLREYPEGVERTCSAAERLDDAKAQLEIDEEALADVPEMPDLVPLRAALRAAQKLGSIGAQIIEADTEGKRLTDEAQAAFERLRPSPGDIARLRELALPSREWVGQSVDQQASLEGDAQALKRERERLASDAGDIAQEREELQLVGAAPTAVDSDSARSQRDERWTGVRAVLDGRSVAKAGLAESFEEAIVEADTVADARIASASQIERAAQVEARARRSAREETRLAERQSELESSHDALARSWEEAWTASGVVAPALCDAPGWLDARDEVLTLTRTAGESTARASVLRGQADSATHTLRSRLRESGVVAADDATLDELGELAEAHIDDADEQSRVRSNLEAAVRRSKRTDHCAARE